MTPISLFIFAREAKATVPATPIREGCAGYVAALQDAEGDDAPHRPASQQRAVKVLRLLEQPSLPRHRMRLLFPMRDASVPVQPIEDVFLGTLLFGSGVSANRSLCIGDGGATRVASLTCLACAQGCENSAACREQRWRSAASSGLPCGLDVYTGERGLNYCGCFIGFDQCGKVCRCACLCI